METTKLTAKQIKLMRSSILPKVFRETELPLINSNSLDAFIAYTRDKPLSDEALIYLTQNISKYRTLLHIYLSKYSYMPAKAWKSIYYRKEWTTIRFLFNKNGFKVFAYQFLPYMFRYAPEDIIDLFLQQHGQFIPSQDFLGLEAAFFRYRSPTEIVKYLKSPWVSISPRSFMSDGINMSVRTRNRIIRDASDNELNYLIKIGFLNRKTDLLKIAERDDAVDVFVEALKRIKPSFAETRKIIGLCNPGLTLQLFLRGDIKNADCQIAFIRQYYTKEAYKDKQAQAMKLQEYSSTAEDYMKFFLMGKNEKVSLRAISFLLGFNRADTADVRFVLNNFETLPKDALQSLLRRGIKEEIELYCKNFDQTIQIP